MGLDEIIKRMNVERKKKATKKLSWEHVSIKRFREEGEAPEDTD